MLTCDKYLKIKPTVLVHSFVKNALVDIATCYSTRSNKI